MAELTQRERITKVVFQLQEEKPFWAYLLLKMRLKEDTEGICKKMGGGMGVDAKGTLIWDKDFVKKLTDSELKGVLAHEVNHMLFMHIMRLGSRQPMPWNVATDIIVNEILRVNGFDLPKGGILCDYNGNLKVGNLNIKNVIDHTAEELYDLIPVDKNSKGNYTIKCNGENKSGFDNHDYSSAKGMTDSEKHELENKWKENVATAAQIAKNRGKVPAGMDRIIDGLLNPKVNWKLALRKYLVSLLPFDFSFNRPNKKYGNMVMPGPLKENIELVAHIDTSGSIGEDELRSFVTELYSILQSHNNVRITLIDCDCEIQEVIELKSSNKRLLSKHKFKGGGGTSHKPVVDLVNSKYKAARCFITLTDGYSDIERCFSDLKCDKLIILNTDYKGLEKYGKVIRI